MRILAIRGRNLASLAGDFAVDFEEEPLAGSGIFAITGPTGAGKSTLLDALSLALFNKLPRLAAAPAGAQIPNGPDQGIGAGDPRAILRHGTGEGYAEVDFAMPDGARYRARWSVKRARQRPDGRLQNHEHSFERIDTSERMGGTRTETLAAIREVIGLSSDQFGRAVLLAQGDFEAFIRADANERALLLERLTGSAIYGSLGRAAYERASQLRAGLAEIERDIAARSGLDEAGRAEAEAELGAARGAEAEAAARLAELEGARRWEERSQALTAAIAAAEEAEAAARVEWEQASPRRAALVQDRRACAHVTAWTAVEGAAAAADAAARRLGGDEEALAAAVIAQAQAMEADALARAVLRDREAEARNLAPELDQARALDHRLGEADRRLGQCEAEAVKRRGELQAATDAAIAARQAHDEADLEHGARLEWLAVNAALQPLAQREDELADQLEEHHSIRAGIETLRAERGAVEARRQEMQAQCDFAAEEVRTADAAWRACRLALESAEAELPAEESLAALTAQQVELGRLERLAAEWRHAEAAFSAAESVLRATGARLRSVAASQAEGTVRRSALSAELPVVRARYDEARRAMALSEAAAHQSAQMLRAQLVEGEPCPVCGASEHQLAAVDRFLAEPLLANRRRTEALQAELTRQERAEAALAAEIEGLSAQAKLLEAEQETQQRQLDSAVGCRDALVIRLDEACAEAGLPEFRDEVEQAIASRQAETAVAMAKLVSAEDRARAARRDEAGARVARDRAKAEEASAQQALSDGSRTVSDLDHKLASRIEAADRVGAVLDRVLKDLTNWRDLAQPAEWLRSRAAEWHAHERKRAERAAALPELRSAMADANGAFISARDRSADAEADEAGARAAHAALSLQRKNLLSGRSVREVEQRLADGRDKAAVGLDAANAKREWASQNQVAAEARRTESLGRREASRAEHERLQVELAAALVAESLDFADVARVARLGLAALDSEGEALQAIERRLGERCAVTSKCRDDLGTHWGVGQPDLLGADLVAATDEAREVRDRASERRAQAELRIRSDDEIRTATAALRERLEVERATAEVWLKLSDLIGDREGRTFRRFAQGLTLDRLLDHANARLAELKPRYALQRGAGGDMLIQVVDNDMAGEVRGLHNLSGGERFLISLALALGLAEMSTAKGVRIESLFIDEGFGALDPASLGQAVSLLEHLHASGRRVGVISHVEELKERIPVKIEVTPTGRGTSRLVIAVS